MDFFFLIVFACVLNQSHGYWLFNDAFHFTILMSLKLKEENKVVPSFESLMENDSIIVVELALLVSNKKGSLWCVGFFPFILNKI